MPPPARFTQSLLADFESAYAHLLRVARRSTGCAETARDLVHDAWVRLAEQERGARQAGRTSPTGPEHPAGLDTPALLHNPTTYLTTLAQHLAMDQHRRDRLQADYLHDATWLQRQAHRGGPDVADHLMYRQALQALEQALAALPERARTAFVAHRVHGEAQADIARRLGVALNTVERDLMLAHACVEDALHRWRGTPPAAAQAAKRGMQRRRSLAALLGMAGLGYSGTIAWQHWQQALEDALLEGAELLHLVHGLDEIEEAAYLGDIVIAYPYASAQAASYRPTAASAWPSRRAASAASRWAIGA